MKYYIITFAIFFSSALFAQDTQAEIERFLTKDWIHTPTSSSVDQSINGKCEKGKMYHFKSNGILEIQTCIQERMRTSTHNWTLVKSEYGDWLVQMDSGPYTLEMKSANGKETLVLVPELKKEETENQRTNIELYRLKPLPETEDTIEE